MHELSIALSILDLVALEAIKQKAHEVKEIELEVGHWAGVDISALSFSMRAAQRYSPFEKAPENNTGFQRHAMMPLLYTALFW